LLKRPYREPGGEWKMRLEVISAGNVVNVVAILDYDDDKNIAIIITTF